MASGTIKNVSRIHMAINLGPGQGESLNLAPQQTSRVLTAAEVASREVQFLMRKKRVLFSAAA